MDKFLNDWAYRLGDPNFKGKGTYFLVSYLALVVDLSDIPAAFQEECQALTAAYSVMISPSFVYDFALFRVTVCHGSRQLKIPVLSLSMVNNLLIRIL